MSRWAAAASLVAVLMLGGVGTGLAGEQAGELPGSSSPPPGPAARAAEKQHAVGAASGGADGAAGVAPKGEGTTAAAAEGGRVVRYGAGRLSVRVWDEDLREVLEEIGRQAAADMKLERLEDRSVTCDFADLPLDEGLQRLLRDQNFTLVYVAEKRGGEPARLRSLEVFSGRGTYASARPDPPPAGAGSRTSSTQPAKPPARSPGLPGLLERYREIPVEGELAEALGSDEVSLQTLFAASLNESDPAVRRAATARMMSVLDADPQAEQFTLDAIDAMDPEALAGLLRGLGEERSVELLREVIGHARGSGVRSAASEVLNRILAPPPEPPEAASGAPAEP